MELTKLNRKIVLLLFRTTDRCVNIKTQLQLKQINKNFGKYLLLTCFFPVALLVGLLALLGPLALKINSKTTSSYKVE